MTKSSKHWYPRYSGDYRAKTAGLSLMQHGAYALLLDEYYNTGKPLDANASVLHRICSALASEEQEAINFILERFFIKTDEGYRNKRADEELIKRGNISEKRKKAANARHANAMQSAMQNGCKTDANAPANAYTSTSTSTSTSNTTVKKKRESSPSDELPKLTRTSISPNFELPEEWLNFALTERKVKREIIYDWFASFKDYYLREAKTKKGKKLDWFMTWKNWCRREHVPYDLRDTAISTTEINYDELEAKYGRQR